MRVKTELEGRAKRFAVRLIKSVSGFPRSPAGQVIGRQLLRSGTSIGANYCEANRAESRDDFIHKVAIAEKEAAETIYWLEICMEADIGPGPDLSGLLQEAKELLAILVTIGRKAKRH